MPKITERPVPPEDLLRRAHEALDAGRFDLAEEALAKDEFDIAALIENLRIYQAELEIQNQELQASRVEVERALARFAAFFETLPMAELIVDGKGMVLEVNAAAEALFELGVQHLRQQFFSRLVVAADRGVAVGAFATAWEAGRAALLEVGFRKTTGEDFIGDLHIARLPGEPGGARQFVCAIVDQSEAVRQRQALRERAEELGRSRAELRERIKELRCLYDVVKLELQPGLAVAEFLERIVARLPSAMQAPTLAAACIELSGHAIASPGFAPTEPMLEVPIALPDGGEGRVQVVYAATDEAASPAFLAEERHLLEAVAGHVASFLRRQAAEEDLSQTRESYRILAEYSPDWEYWLGPEGRYLYLSPACEALTGWPPAAFEADPDLFARLIHPADRERYLAHHREVLAGCARARCDDVGYQELRLQTRSGEWRWFEHYCVSVSGADGQWRGRRGVNRDITARKQAEAEVARMTRLYATLSATNQAILRVESEAELLPEFCRIAVQEGGLAACLVSRPRGEAGRFATVAAAYSQRQVGDGRGDASAGGPGRPKSGVSFPLLIGGAMAGVATFYAPEPDFFARDVVELLDEMSRDLALSLDRFAQEAARVLAEQGLRVRERQLAAIFRAAPVGIGLIKHRQILHTNDHFAELLGYRQDEIIGQGTRRFYADEAEYERVGRALYAGIAAHESPSVEARMRRRDGEVICVQASVASLDSAAHPGVMVFTVLDITERKRAEVALQDSHRRLTEAERLAQLGHWELDLASGDIVWSEQIYCIFGLDPSRPPPSLEEHDVLFHPEDLPRYQQLLRRSMTEGVPFEYVLRIRRADGAIRFLSAQGQARKDDNGEVQSLFGTAQDVTEQHLAAEHARQAAKVFESTADGVMITDAAERILAVNRAFTEITGFSEAEVLGHTPRLLQSDRHDRTLYQAMWASLRRVGSWRGELWNRRKNGELFPVLLTISAVSGPDGAVTNYVAVFSDMTSLRRSEEQLEHLAHHDPLTDLPNSSLFRSRLEHGLQRAERDRRALGVLIMDLDRFKVINESMGHASGDEILRQVSLSLGEALRSGDTLARLGGDEFGVILEDLKDPSAAVAIAQRLMELCARPRELAGREIAVTACVGIGIYPADGRDGESLLRHADVALSKAKDEGPHAFQFFEPMMERGAIERLHVESCLRHAQERGELTLHYQPQIRLADGALVGAEALLRWHSAELGQVPPGSFIPLAEEMGLIDEIGAWVLRRACEQLLAWEAGGLCLPRVAVNLSIRQIEQGDLVERFGEIFRQTGVATEWIELEITESMVMRRADLSVEALNGLRDLGVRLVVDDFGTGYSSLAYLRRLPLHQLKIDKSFVDDLLDDPNSRAIAQAIIALGHSLGLEVLAEGVELAEQAQILRSDGCDLAQGYHYARPLPPDELVERWLRPAAKAGLGSTPGG
ncbi:PAS domain S-box/diguanylate cyclase (GGDEF) domain-containing protein [Thioflavicoccus mobilis 8321]|uniref:PAS domain S-box/diguanylate cyclase (GGDEF) domain-containing protein n=1 Tax=Thioflavicoccus mobilis 8321 TaxID=765912 RepID=L0GZZ2_9GAMM|nr:EAL domain-containing protein [Thioflavicoccus mobilis]AGA91521.1 PAS domain S-box/diguanylate cyclase (GGDEF) domain-containing protein [Thioflavicoccus mobilis 8321]